MALRRAQRAAAGARDRGRRPGGHRRRRGRDRGGGVLPPSASLVPGGRHSPLLPLHRLILLDLVISSVPLVGPRPFYAIVLPVSSPRRRRCVSGSTARLRRLLATSVETRADLLTTVVFVCLCSLSSWFCRYAAILSWRTKMYIIAVSPANDNDSIF